MKRAARFLALSLCLALALSGCRISTPANVLSVDGTDIPSGLYLAFQVQAYNEAQTKLPADTQDPAKAVFTEQIEGTAGEEWIHNRTLEFARTYVYNLKAYEEQGLSYTNEEMTSIQDSIDSNWKSAGSYLEPNGIGYDSFKEYNMNDVRHEALYEAYSTDNADKVSDTDAKKYMDETYTHVNAVTLPVTLEDGTAIEDADLETVKGYAEDLKTALAKGDKTMEELLPDTLEKVFAVEGREYKEDVLSTYLVDTYVREDSTSFPEDLVAEMMGASVGDAGLYMLSGKPVVYVKVANYSETDDFAQYRDAMVAAITRRDFDAQVKEQADAYEVVENKGAVRSYSAKKIVNAAA